MSKTFIELRNEANNKASDVSKEIAELKRKLDDAEKRQKEIGKDVNFVKMLEGMAISSKPWFEWTCETYDDPNHYGDSYVLERHEYYTGMYEFSIIIRFRKDLKKWKYEVQVSGKKQMLNDSPQGSSHFRSYGNYHYIKNKYMDWKPNKHGTYVWQKKEGVDLEQKFTSLESAREFVKEWQEKLLEDHKEDIKGEKRLYNQAKSEYNTGNKIVVSVEDWNTRTTFIEMLDLLPNLDKKQQRDRFANTILLEGNGISDTIKHLISQYKLDAKVLVG